MHFSLQLSAGEMGLIPAWAINGVVASCLPAGLLVGDGFVTDGFDNVAKLRRLKRRADCAAVDQPPRREGRADTTGSQVGLEVRSKEQPPLPAAGRGAQVEIVGPAPAAEVFFFVATDDDMVPPAFGEALLRARYGDGTDGKESSGGEESSDDEAEAGREAGNDAGNEAVSGWRAWFTRLQTAALTAAASLDSDAEVEGPGAAVSPPSLPPRSPNRTGPESPGAGAGGAKAQRPTGERQLDGVPKSVSAFLCRDVLCEDLSKAAGSSKGSSKGSSGSGGGSLLDERRAWKGAAARPPATSSDGHARLAAARLGRVGTVRGGHGAFFGDDRRAAATYEAFLRHIGLLAH